MSDDLRRPLQDLHGRAPDGAPNLVRVLRAGRRRRLRRRAAVGGLASIVLLGVAAGVPRLVDDRRVAAPDEKNDVADHEDGTFVPARKNEATYELYDVRILYPWAPVDSSPISRRERDDYCSAKTEWECGHRREQAGFSYHWRWATKEYPGEVQCRVVLSSADGSVVGRTTWGLTGLETTSRQRDVVGMHVSGRPVTARAACEAGAYAPGPGVEVEFVRAGTWRPTYVRGQSPPPERIRLVFEATALAEDHVDSRMCFLKVWFESGRTDKAQFTTNRGEGTWTYETGYPLSDPVADARIRCRAIRASDS
ncbi:MAG TPA: hypothetical protein VG318_01270 [Actinomycetota bacterium]|nr:hypothetical protein [Actinomycetota bacterium]